VVQPSTPLARLRGFSQALGNVKYCGEDNTMNILLIGGTGLVGSYLLPKLVDCHHHVFTLTRRSDNIEKIKTLGATGILGDIRHPAEWSQSFKNLDLIILLAMPSEQPGKRINKRRKAALRVETNDFFTNSLDLALQYDVPIILPGGTSFTTIGDDIADETWPIQRVGLTEIGKDTDDMIFKAIQRQKPPMIQLLFGKIYGNGGLFRFQYDMMNKNKAKIIGDGGNCIPNIHADDVSSAIMTSIEKMPIGEKIIIADDTPVTQKEFMYYMAELMGKKKPVSIPDFIIKFILGNDIYDVIKMNCKVSNHKAKRLLGWKPTYPSYKEGLEITIKEMARSLPYFD
jgi:nucleoside-diphosphate-sugar epimerase